MKKPAQPWNNRIIGHDVWPASRFMENPRNWRLHPSSQREALGASLGEIGWIDEVTVNTVTGFVLDGHLRVTLALAQGDETPVPVTLVSLTEEEELLALATFDPITGMAETDKRKLAEVIAGAQAQSREMKQLLENISIRERAIIAHNTGTEPDAPAARMGELQAKWDVQLGQCWQAGKHRIYCGDSETSEGAAMVKGPSRAWAVLTDPPYGMNLDTDYTAMQSPFDGRTYSHEHKPVSGDDRDYDPRPLFDLYAAPEMFLWGADYYIDRIPGRLNGSWLVWDKRADGELDRMFGSCFELCWSRKAHKRELIRVRWAGVFGTETQDVRERVHPTQKPIQAMEWIMERYLEPSLPVIDPYLGSGTTLIAAERLGRVCLAAERDPEYIALALERFKALTGIAPELV